jgi:hypothetical protein
VNFAGSDGDVDDSATGAGSDELIVSAVVARYRAVTGSRIRDVGNSDLSKDVMVMRVTRRSMGRLKCSS